MKKLIKEIEFLDLALWEVKYLLPTRFLKDNDKFLWVLKELWKNRCLGNNAKGW